MKPQFDRTCYDGGHVVRFHTGYWPMNWDGYSGKWKCVKCGHEDTSYTTKALGVFCSTVVAWLSVMIAEVPSDD